MIATLSSRPSQPSTRSENGQRGVRRVNVGASERFVSLMGGGLLAAYGLTRGTGRGLVLAAVGAGLAYRGATGHCQMYQSLGMSTVSRAPQTAIPSGQGVKVEESVTIAKSREELFAFWRRLENLPRVMKHLVSVTETENGRSHWVAHGPLGNVEWDAEIITERPNELIGWRSVEGSQVATAGSVHFQSAPGGHGTEVKVVLSYNPPAGQLGAALAWLTGRDPQAEIREDLRTFKRVMETGSSITTEGQPRGQCR